MGNPQDWADIRRELAHELARRDTEEQTRRGGPLLTEMPWEALCEWLSAFREEARAEIARRAPRNPSILQ